MEDLAAREPHKATGIPRLGRSRGRGPGAPEYTLASRTPSLPLTC